MSRDVQVLVGAIVLLGVVTFMGGLVINNTLRKIVERLPSR